MDKNNLWEQLVQLPYLTLYSKLIHAALELDLCSSLTPPVAAEALAPGGVVLAVSEGIAPNLSGPWDMVTGYLPYYLNGMDLGIKTGEIPEAARQAGFSQVETRQQVLCSSTQEIHILRK